MHKGIFSIQTQTRPSRFFGVENNTHRPWDFPPLSFLGITTLLTTCTIAISGRDGIPKVSYSTALDIFLLMCFSFVFAALVEYAGVNYFTKNCQKEGVVEESEEVGRQYICLML